MNHRRSAARPESPDARSQHFDQAARDLHAGALGNVSPRVRVRLQQARRQASLGAPEKRSNPLWAWAGGTAMLALALGVGVQFQGPPEAVPVASQSTVHASDPALALFEDDDAEISGLLAALDEHPDFYLWLAANDGALSRPTERYP